MDCSTPGLPVHHQLPEFTQTHVHWVGDAIQPSHHLSSPSSPTFKLSQNWCLWTVVLKKTLESPLDCKEIQPVHPKGDQSWVFIGRTDAPAETPIHWPLMCRANSFEKTLILGKFFFFLMSRFKPAFSLTSFTFIKSLFSFSSLSAIRVVSSAYLRVLIHTCLKSGPNVSMLAQLPAGLFRVRVTTVRCQGELSFVCTRKPHQTAKATDLSPKAGEQNCRRDVSKCHACWLMLGPFVFYSINSMLLFNSALHNQKKIAL